MYHGLLLQVVTLVGEPFVFITSMPKSGKCEDLDDSNANRKHIRCTGKVYGEHAKQVAADGNDHCCYGKIIRLQALRTKVSRVQSDSVVCGIEV